MEVSKSENEKSQDFNKEEKYRNEVFNLLETDLESSEMNKNELIKTLFSKETIDNDQLLNLIKSLK
jgi:hypothetical protein